jgi:hypothetical protein
MALTASTIIGQFSRFTTVAVISNYEHKRCREVEHAVNKAVLQPFLKQSIALSFMYIYFKCLCTILIFAFSFLVSLLVA